MNGLPAKWTVWCVCTTECSLNSSPTLAEARWHLLDAALTAGSTWRLLSTNKRGEFHAHIACLRIAAAVTPEPGAQQPSPPPAPPACDSEGHAGFDFWLGEWDVYQTGGDAKVADSRIGRKHNGCAVTESWIPLCGAGGTSLNHWDINAGAWRQKWVGSSPGAVEFTGGVTEGKMVLTEIWPSPGALHTLVRMSYSANEDGSVRPFGESSTDHGVSWQSAFDFTFRPKEDAPE